VLAFVEIREIGMNIGWEHFVSQYDAARFVSSDGRDTRHIQFVREFASVVSVLQVRHLFWSLGLRTLLTAQQDKTNNVIDLYKDILRAVEDLATCSYTEEAFTELLSRIQSAVRLDHSIYFYPALKHRP
jgi:dynein heavy chain 1